MEKCNQDKPKTMWPLILVVMFSLPVIQAEKYNFGYAECTYNSYKFKCLGSRIDIVTQERMGLTSFPRIGASTTCVRIKSNKIEQFPKDLSSYKSVNSLDLSNNRIRELPVNLKDLSSLEILDLTNNGISQLSPLTKYPPSLRGLILSNNLLTSLPMIQIPGLFVLDLSGNQFTEIPPNFCVSKELIRVDVTDNPLADDVSRYVDTVNFCRNRNGVKFCLFVEKPEIRCECDSIAPLIGYEPNFCLGAPARGRKFTCTKDSFPDYVGMKLAKISQSNVTSTCNLSLRASTAHVVLPSSLGILIVTIFTLFL